MKIKLGNIVRDATSGFSGTAIQFCEALNGNIQVAIQPMMKEGDTTYPEAMFLDTHLVDFVSDGVADRATPAVKTNIKIGQKVTDLSTDFYGIAVKKATYINGCISFGVVAPVREGGLLNNNSEINWISSDLLEAWQSGHLNRDKSKTAIGVKPFGGPAQRVHRG